jgi:endonuclease/exonuclease/phosphatase (EEP) superfamily protein YafD
MICVRCVMRTVRRFLGFATVVLAATLALTGVLALGGVISPLLDSLANLAPLVFAGSLLTSALALAVPARARDAALLLAGSAAVSSALLIAPEFLRSTGPLSPPGAPGQIKVIQFNVWRENRHFDEVVKWIVEQRPDVVVIEETTPALRDLLIARTGWHVADPRPVSMIFTPSRYLEMRRPRLGHNAKLTWINATYCSSSGPFEVVATHLSWPTDAVQTVQRRDLGAVLSTLPRDRLILAGDFNSTPWSFATRADDRHWGLVRRDRALMSWPARLWGLRPWPLPFLPIDHVYAGPGWALTGVTRGPYLGSDHFPLVVTLAPVERTPLAAGSCVSPIVTAGRYPGNPAH